MLYFPLPTLRVTGKHADGPAYCAQAASEPAYGDIVTALLFSREGQEAYLRPPACFNIPPQQPISFAEIQELARKTGQTALGYISTNIQSQLAAGSTDAAETASSDSSGVATAGEVGGRGESRKAGVGRLLPWAHSVAQKLSRAATVHLGLSATEQVVLRDGDYIVVLAEDF
jgi:hypothetical protein